MKLFQKILIPILCFTLAFPLGVLADDCPPGSTAHDKVHAQTSKDMMLDHTQTSTAATKEGTQNDIEKAQEYLASCIESLNGVSDALASAANADYYSIAKTIAQAAAGAALAKACSYTREKTGAMVDKAMGFTEYSAGPFSGSGYGVNSPYYSSPSGLRRGSLSPGIYDTSKQDAADLNKGVPAGGKFH